MISKELEQDDLLGVSPYQNNYSKETMIKFANKAFQEGKASKFAEDYHKMKLKELIPEQRRGKMKKQRLIQITTCKSCFDLEESLPDNCPHQYGKGDAMTNYLEFKARSRYRDNIHPECPLEIYHQNVEITDEQRERLFGSAAKVTLEQRIALGNLLKLAENQEKLLKEQYLSWIPEFKHGLDLLSSDIAIIKDLIQ